MIYVMSGGGSGATLTVTSTGAGTVTVSNTALGKNYSKPITAGGSVTFKGLKTGTWTVTLSDGTQTTTKPVTINADYTVTVAYFAATINVAYPEGSTCTCSDGSTTLAAPDTTGTWACIVPNAGTWTVKAVSGDKTASKAVEITAEGQIENVTLAYQLYIFKSGSGLTAGYSVEGTGGNVSNDSISWSGNSESGGIYVYIKPTVALNNYTKLCVDFECSYNWGGDYGMAFGVGNDTVVGIKISSTHWTAKVTSTAQGGIARNTVQCDISALTDSEYIKIVGSYSAGKVYNIWLE